jgi:hypothetical protein
METRASALGPFPRGSASGTIAHRRRAPEATMSVSPAGQRTISILCARCGVLLYRYHKGGTGGLVKCFLERIAEDRTNGDMKCPQCGQEFARPRTIGGRPAHKIIAGKVFTRGMRRK